MSWPCSLVKSKGYVRILPIPVKITLFILFLAKSYIMKRLFLFAVLITITIFSNAQTGKIKKAPPKAPAVACKNLSDSVSYAIGMSVASFYKSRGITAVNTAMITQAMNDVFAGKPYALDEGASQVVLSNYMNTKKAEKANTNIAAGEKFLAQNKTKPGVKTTPSGLQYEVLAEGNGAHPTAADQVTVNYEGTLLDGTEFDNSYKRGQPITFALNGVIPGWTEGLQLMTPGSKYRFWIPYNLGYGANGYSSIPGGALLIFEVELIEVKK
jgi:FKBP-type peptidyl-prolyl cis-trans isomerase